MESAHTLSSLWYVWRQCQYEIKFKMQAWALTLQWNKYCVQKIMLQGCVISVYLVWYIECHNRFRWLVSVSLVSVSYITLPCLLFVLTKHLSLVAFAKVYQPNATQAVVTESPFMKVTALSRDESKACPSPGAAEESERTWKPGLLSGAGSVTDSLAAKHEHHHC